MSPCTPTYIFKEKYLRLRPSTVILEVCKHPARHRAQPKSPTPLHLQPTHFQWPLILREIQRFYHHRHLPDHPKQPCPHKYQWRPEKKTTPKIELELGGQYKTLTLDEHGDARIWEIVTGDISDPTSGSKVKAGKHRWWQGSSTIEAR